MFDEPPAKPQSVGDLIGRSFRLYRLHLGLIFKTLLGPSILAAVGALGIQFYFYRMIDNSMHQPPLIPVIAFCGSLLVVLIAKWVLTVRQLSFVRMAAGFDNNYATAFQWMNKRKWKVLAVYAIGFAAVALLCGIWAVELVAAAAMSKGNVLLTFLAAVGIMVAPLGIFLSVCFVLLVGFISFCVLACEEQRVGTIINRGMTLTFGDFWRTLAFGLLLYTVVTVITVPLTVPLIIAHACDMFRHGLASGAEVEGYQMPLYLMVVSHVWESVLNMLLWPVAFMAFGLLYHDLRLRQEGLDIKRQLEQLERTAL